MCVGGDGGVEKGLYGIYDGNQEDLIKEFKHKTLQASLLEDLTLGGQVESGQRTGGGCGVNRDFKRDLMIKTGDAWTNEMKAFEGCKMTEGGFV